MLRQLLLASMLVALPAAAQSPPPAKALGFRLWNRVGGQPSFTIMQGNRVACGISFHNYGQVGNDAFEDCVWPRGTNNFYVFAGGLRVAGVIGPEATGWAGDTTGAFFYDGKGTTEHGTGVEGIWHSAVAQDARRWPDLARVPTVGGEPYRLELRGQVAASDDDVWYLSRETDVNQTAGRRHPLGLAVEARTLAWNRPRGNEDILYAVYTFYNISSTNPSAYAGVRPELGSVLLDLARQYHRDVSAKYGITLPAGGYTIQRYFADLYTDADVGFAGANVASVNLPLSVGFTWDPRFSVFSYSQFDPTDHGVPFFAGTGFYGTKVLAAPIGGNAIQQFTGIFNSGAVSVLLNDARDVIQLYRHLGGTAAPDLLACQTDPQVTHVCAVWPSPLDIRQSVSVSGGDLLPGQSATMAVAYLFAAPYGGCGACNVLPGNPFRLADPALFPNGVNQVDSITGYTGFTDFNGDGQLGGGEIRAAPRSLLGKAQMAQAIFDARFLVPTAPVAPEFGATEVNALYDPNFRKFDVEGYRIYRGRSSNPAELVQVAQFDYSGTTIDDYTGRINPVPTCAPELGLRGCGVNFDSLVPGQPLTAHRTVPIDIRLIQVRDGDRIRLPGNTAAILHADTVGGFEQATCLCSSGVPFLFVDKGVRNGSDYFYAVTAFDVNSAQSGPASMESVRLPKRVRPTAPAVNLVSSASVSVTLEGRGKVLDSGLAVPTWDSVTGQFSGPFPPANRWSATLVNVAREVVAGNHEARIRLDSLSLGQVDGTSFFVNARPGIPALLHLTLTADGDVTHFSLPVPQAVAAFGQSPSDSGTQRLTIFHTDPAASARYGAAPMPVYLDLTTHLGFAEYNGEWGAGFTTQTGTSNGSRWFDGPSPARNEIAIQPTAGNCQLGCFPFTFNNAGSLTGVTTVYQPRSYLSLSRSWRNIGMAVSTAHRGADYNVYWGGPGVIDSVIDVTHNVPVPFSEEAGGTWGILNTLAQGAGGFDNRPTVLTPYDWSCVEPFRSRLTLPQTVWFPCSAPAPFRLSRQAALGPIAFASGDTLITEQFGARNPANLSPEPGFALYLSGTITQFSMSTLPSKPAVWALRDYTGYIDERHVLQRATDRPWTAVGTELVVRVSAINGTEQAQDRDLRRVHAVPDPFYLTGGLPEGEGIRFVHLPARAIVRIYSAGGTLLRVLEHKDAALTDNVLWDLRSRNGQRVASGVYFFHIEAGDARRVGRMTVVNFAN